MILALLVAAALAVWLLRAPPRPEETPVGHRLSRGLPRWLVLHSLAAAGGAGAQEARVGARQARRALLEEAVVVERPWLGDGLVRTLDAAERLLDEPAPDGCDAQPLDAALGKLNRALDQHQEPFFIDSDCIASRRSGRAQLAFYVHHVRSRRVVTVGAKEIVSLHVERIDRLNWRRGALGYTAPHMEVAVVRRDEIETSLVRRLGPALGPGAAMPLIDPDSLDDRLEWQARVQARAGRSVRAALEQLLPGRSAELKRLGELLTQRRALILEWRAALLRRGLHMRPPKTFELRDSYLEMLEGALPSLELHRLRRVQDELEAEKLPALFEALVQLRAESVERHEVQHRLDYARGEVLPVPEPVRRWTGYDPEAGPPTSYVDRCRYELSALLSELARGEGQVHLDLALLLGYLLDADHSGGPYWLAAGAIFEGLGEELGVGQPIVLGRRVQRAAVAAHYEALAAVDGPKLAEAARRIWERWFAARLPRLQPDVTSLPLPPASR